MRCVFALSLILLVAFPAVAAAQSTTPTPTLYFPTPRPIEPPFFCGVVGTDTDGDGIADVDEVRPFNTNYYGGLLDINSPDTDSDGFNDYEEVCVMRTHPLSALSPGPPTSTPVPPTPTPVPPTPTPTPIPGPGLDPDTWSSGWPQSFASLLFASIIGKALGAETRVLLLSLIGAVLTGSWVGVFVAAFISIIPWPLDAIRKFG